jgi:hypothetical protein
MPVWPKSIFVVGTRWEASRLARRLRRKKTSASAQRRALTSLVGQLAKTSFWKKAGVEPAMSYAQFKARLPLRKYEDVAPAIRRMQRGEADVLWPGQCPWFATTAGTTAGPGQEPKMFPVTSALRAHFRQAGWDALLAYAARAGSPRIFSGRQLFLGGSTQVTRLAETDGFTALAGDLTAFAELDMPASFRRHCYEPGPEVAGLSNWDAKTDAAIASAPAADLTLLAGMPHWMAGFVEKVRQTAETSGQSVSQFREIWPRLECLVHGGAPIGPFAEQLRQLLGPGVKFHEIYAATEAFIAMQDGDARDGLRLIADAGVFYEFVPAEEFDEARLAVLGTKTLPLEDVRTGIDYAVIVTTPGGLCRHVLGDLVRFVSTEPPRLQWVGRTAHQLTAFGERVCEKELSETLTGVCQRNGWMIVNFHVAPLFTNPLLGTSRGRHEWWVELKPGTVINPTGPQIAAEIDVELCRTNPGYRARREALALDAPVVRLVMPGLFEHWLRGSGQWDGRSKVPRSRSDRKIADPLAEIAQFAKD